MTPQVVSVQQIIEYLTDIPAVVVSRVDGLVESAGRPRVLPLPPACAVDGFQAYNYAPRPDALYPDAPQTEVALIR